MFSKPTYIIGLVLVMVTVGQFATGIYLPSMPTIAHYFQSSKQPVQWILSAYYLSYGMSQLIYGPLADKFGRRPTAISSMFIFLIGAILACFAISVKMLVIGSFIMGMGLGSAGMLARTTPRDLFSGNKLVTVNSWMNIAIVFVPLLAPLFGGYIQQLLGWRFNFMFLLIYGGAITILMLISFTETKPITLQTKPIFSGYKILLSNRLFIKNLVSTAATYATVAAYEVFGVFLYQDILHRTPIQVGWLLVIPFLGFVVGCYLVAKLQHFLGIQKSITVGSIIMLISSLLMLVFGILHYISIAVILIPMILCLIGAGFVLPTAVANAMEPIPANAGVGGALLGGSQNVAASLTAGLLSTAHIFSQIPLALTLMLLAAICYIASIGKGKNNITIQDKIMKI